MYHRFLFVLFCFIGFSIQSQTVSKDFRSKKFTIKNDTIQIDSVSINSQRFRVLNSESIRISPKEYTIDFRKATLIIDAEKYSEITIEYFRFPNFITKIYTPFNEKLIVPDGTNTGKLYSLTTNKEASEIKLFNGLQTNGFIARGVVSGNNQNLVTNSALDLEISGKLSKNVTLRANIFDTNIPLQENGYSQNITDFDRIFIEMFTKIWRVKAGDISIQNKESYFLNFNKQIAGLQVEATINKKLNVGASGAIVRGKFRSFKFTGIEGNQGPYKLFGENNEPGIVIIAGSETVYINGIALQNGENKEYTIDYNLAEVAFNTTYPITNDMRIVVEFQYSDRNYSRFITYEETSYKGDTFNVSGYFYSESDAKNQPLQQSLTEEQKEVLVNAGNNQDLMISESAFRDEYSENKILYKKTRNGAIEIFEHSTTSTDELYFVTFTNVGQNKGDYSIDQSTAVGTIFKYRGTNLGEYSPIIRLVAPTKSQFFIVKSDYAPSKKTKLDTEIAFSNNDANLFSSIDDNQNTALAAKVGWEQILIDKKWQLKSTINHEFVQQNFKTIQRWESVEFNRDWNIVSNNATKNLFQSELTLQNKKNNFVLYRYNHLTYTDIFNGNKHELSSKITLKNTSFSANGSLLNNTSSIEDNSFFRAKAKIEHSFTKTWVGSFINFETNDRKNKTSQEFINLSHRFKEYEAYLGIGDSTKIFAKIGVNYRNNDSIRLNKFTEVNNRKTVYVNSKIIENKKTNLSVYANYRITENAFKLDEKSLNSKIIFNQRLLNDFVNLGTMYETSSGNIARQDYVYVKTEPGQGFYTWIDYNNDGVQDFNEFEIAQFQDQAEYLRVPKPNLRYIATQRAKWNQSVTLNFVKWAEKEGFKKTVSHFYNQSFLTIENEKERIGNSFHVNPFDIDENNLIGLNFSFRNSFYFNRNLQQNSFTYTYGTSKNKQQYFIGNQENNIKIRQLDYSHKFSSFWLIDLMTKTSNNKLETENFSNRNYEISVQEIEPKISFLYNKDNRFSVSYHFKKKKNKLQDFEKLHQQKFGLEYFYIDKKKNQISANIQVYLNDFKGNTNTPVAYQMLEGLQAGENYTWNLLFNKKLNSFLNLNLNYLGRKSENSKTIHTGSVKLKAVF